jgi:hypothetical protein
MVHNDGQSTCRFMPEAGEPNLDRWFKTFEVCDQRASIPWDPLGREGGLLGVLYEKISNALDLEIRVVENRIRRSYGMCRNIKTLFNFDPPVTAEEVRAAALQFVRKISGFNKPSKANEAAFLGAIDEIAAISTRLLHSLDTNAPPKNREEEAAKAKARAAERFGA